MNPFKYLLLITTLAAAGCSDSSQEWLPTAATVEKDLRSSASDTSKQANTVISLYEDVLGTGTTLSLTSSYSADQRKGFKKHFKKCLRKKGKHRTDSLKEAFKAANGCSLSALDGAKIEKTPELVANFSSVVVLYSEIDSEELVDLLPESMADLDFSEAQFAETLEHLSGLTPDTHAEKFPDAIAAALGRHGYAHEAAMVMLLGNIPEDVSEDVLTKFIVGTNALASARGIPSGVLGTAFQASKSYRNSNEKMQSFLEELQGSSQIISDAAAGDQSEGGLLSAIAKVVGDVIAANDSSSSSSSSSTPAVAGPSPFSVSLDLGSSTNFHCDGGGAGSCASSENFVVGGGSVSSIAVDLATNTSAKWNEGNLNGVTIASDNLVLNATDNLAWTFDESWTPRHEDLAVHYNFEGTGASVENVVGETFDGAKFGNTSREAAAAVAGSKGISFDGDGDYIDTGYVIDGTGNKDFTIMVWLKMDAALGDGDYVYVMGATNGSAPYDLFEAKIYGGASHPGKFHTLHRSIQTNIGGRHSSSDNIGDQEWHHYAVVFDADGGGDAVRLYVDGRQESTGSFSDYDSWDLDLPLMLGGVNLNGSHWNDKAFAGDIDEFAIWEAGLTSAEILKIYLRQKIHVSGIYTSKVFDLGASSTAAAFSIDTPLPFGKPIAAGAESSDHYSGLTSNLSSGLLGLWHLDESAAPFADSSGNGHNSSGTGGTFEAGLPGLIGNATRFEGGRIELGTSISPPAITISAWIHPRNDFEYDDYQTVVSKGEDGVWDIQYASDNKIDFAFHDGGSWKFGHKTSSIPNNTWTHVVAMYDASFTDGDLKVYINGELSVNVTDGSKQNLSMRSTTDTVVIGARTDNSRDFQGLIDEVAIWDRGLSAAEVVEVYRRGANQFRVQVQSCSEISCSSADWVGPGGSYSGFSEWHNYSAIASGNPSGTVDPLSPYFSFSNFVTQPGVNRYLRYRVFVDSLDQGTACGGSQCVPVIDEIVLNERVGDIATGAVVPVFRSGHFVNSAAVPYVSLTSVNISATGCKHQLSADGGASFLYHDGVNWTAASSDAPANLSNDADLVTLVGFPTGGELVIKTMPATNGAACNASSIAIVGLR